MDGWMDAAVKNGPFCTVHKEKMDLSGEWYVL
jgi:hypothetical protein